MINLLDWKILLLRTIEILLSILFSDQKRKHLKKFFFSFILFPDITKGAKP